MLSRREFLQRAAGTGMGYAAFPPRLVRGGTDPIAEHAEPFFQTRGVVLVVKDLETYDWPTLAKAAGAWHRYALTERAFPGGRGAGAN